MDEMEECLQYNDDPEIVDTTNIKTSDLIEELNSRMKNGMLIDIIQFSDRLHHLLKSIESIKEEMNIFMSLYRL